MKAVVYEKYGPPEVLEMKEVERPQPKEKEVLIRIHATSVTAGDWRMRKADPFMARFFNGLFRPKKINILGFEVAGVVEALGSQVTRFQVGDPVFASSGLAFGGYAEYICISEEGMIAKKPDNISFEEAATIPIGAGTALRFLRKAEVKSGNQVLIYGASGSVGTFAVQIAKSFGAMVTGVCSTRNLDLVRSLGADRLIDYTKEDFSKHDTPFDVVFDAVGKAKKSACKKVLKPGGKYISVWQSAKEEQKDILVLKELIESGKLKSVIDRTYTLDQIREAHAYVQQFRKRGNVAVKVK
jgi:NADPH:quinone reductase-like Zn-dependent oxidoreductase